MTNFMYGDFSADKDKVTLSVEEYEELLEDSAFLDALTDAGVDDWEGYEEAKRIYDERNLVGA